MTTNEKVLAVIFKCIDEINEQEKPDKTLLKNIDEVIYGNDGKLDSLGLVNFIVAIEEKVEDKFGVPIILADERAMSQKQSPFRTVGSLVDYIVILLEEKTNE